MENRTVFICFLSIDELYSAHLKLYTFDYFCGVIWCIYSVLMRAQQITLVEVAVHDRQMLISFRCFFSVVGQLKPSWQYRKLSKDKMSGYHVELFNHVYVLEELYPATLSEKHLPSLVRVLDRLVRLYLCLFSSTRQ